MEMASAQDRNIRMHIVYPPAAFVENGGPVINITKPPYNAKGDGVTDDTQAFVAVFETIQDMNEKKLPGNFVYVPNGTYLVSDTLARKTRLTVSEDYNYRLIGEDRAETIIKLKDNLPAFAAGTDKAVINGNPSNKGNGGMMWGHLLRNLTIDTGKGNPGAVGVTWRGANATAIDNLTIRSGDGAGSVGLYFREWCVQGHFCDITVEGFDYGIKTQQPAETNPTVEHVSLSSQKIAGIMVDRSTPCFRKIKSTNSVPAFKVGGAGCQCVIIDSDLSGGAAGTSAIKFKDSAYSHLFVRNVTIGGYADSIMVEGTSAAKGLVKEWSSKPAFCFDPKIKPETLNLPIEDATLVPWEDNPAKWATPGDFQGSDYEKIQAALNSGKPAICFPKKMVLSREDPPFKIPASVRQIDFMAMDHKLYGGFDINEASTVPLWIENPGDRPMFRITAQRNLNGRSGTMSCKVVTDKKVTLHFQSICRFAGSESPLFCPPNATLFCRSVNEENWSDKPTPNFYVNGGTMWVLGFKTEAQNTAFHAANGGTLEVLGGYVNFGGKTERQNPDVINEDSSVSYIGTNFMSRTHHYGIWETRDGFSKKFENSAFPRRGSAKSGNYIVPLYVGLKDSKFETGKLKLPEGTKIEASFATDPNGGPAMLFDGDLGTWMVGAGGSGPDENTVTSISLKFPQAVSGPSGIVTGTSDKFHNYYPEVMEFWTDTNDDGKSDKKVGETNQLGPAQKCEGTYMFEKPLGKINGFEIRVTKQHIGGSKRAWTMNEIVLLRGNVGE